VPAVDVEIFIKEAGRGPTHLRGFPFTASVLEPKTWARRWTPWSKRFSRGSRSICRVRFFEHPAAGRYERRQARRIIGVLDALQIQRAILVGTFFRRRRYQ